MCLVGAHSASVEVRGIPHGGESLCPLFCGFQELDSGCQSYWQMPLPAAAPCLVS